MKPRLSLNLGSPCPRMRAGILCVHHHTDSTWNFRETMKVPRLLHGNILIPRPNLIIYWQYRLHCAACILFTMAGALPPTAKPSGVVSCMPRTWMSSSQSSPPSLRMCLASRPPTPLLPQDTRVRCSSSSLPGIQASTFEPSCPTWVSQARQVVPSMALAEPV